MTPQSAQAGERDFVISPPTEDGNRFIVPRGRDDDPPRPSPAADEPEGA